MGPQCNRQRSLSKELPRGKAARLCYSEGGQLVWTMDVDLRGIVVDQEMRVQQSDSDIRDDKRTALSQDYHSISFR
jgi:hypothetical protein